MADSMGKAVRKLAEGLRTEPFHEPVADDQERRIAIMAARYQAGQDIWTGKDLTGQARDEWEGKRIPDECSDE